MTSEEERSGSPILIVYQQTELFRSFVELTIVGCDLYFVSRNTYCPCKVISNFTEICQINFI
jgi:hypothetical protein